MSRPVIAPTERLTWDPINGVVAGLRVSLTVEVLDTDQNPVASLTTYDDGSGYYDPTQPLRPQLEAMLTHQLDDAADALLDSADRVVFGR